jgi:hypothetical protein
MLRGRGGDGLIYPLYIISIERFGCLLFWGEPCLYCWRYERAKDGLAFLAFIDDLGLYTWTITEGKWWNKEAERGSNMYNTG